MESTQLSVYSIQVSGIRCTNCAAKITTNLTSNQSIRKVNVNVIHEKVIVYIDSQSVLTAVLDSLNGLGFTVMGNPVLLSTNDKNERTLILESKENIEGVVKPIPGILGVNRNQDRYYIQYNPEILKGREVAELLETNKTQFAVVNERVESGKVKNKISNSKQELVECVCLAGYFFIVMILSSVDQFEPLMVYPSGGVYSFLILISVILTLYTFLKYGRRYIVSSFNNYVKYRAMNMQTLVALGAVSALCLFVFEVVRYTFVETHFHKEHVTMQLLDSLVSSTLIVLTVTIGKHIERRIKINIEKTTSEIFPESELFQNTTVQWVQLRNRKLMVLREKPLDVVLVEKEDVVRLKEGRLLLDVIVMSGEVTAIDSVLTGSEEIVAYTKGDRIKSGSVIVKSVDCLAEIENVFERGALLEIGAQINMVTTGEQHEQTGIQAICQKMSFYFVKTVIFLAIAVGAIWVILIQAGVEVPDCEVCWVVERVIGVLVASCPCALGLAVPTVIAIALNIAYKKGILIRKNIVFENGSKCKVVAFDKTGTLFVRVNSLEFIVNKEVYQENLLWEIVAMVEKNFRHPIAEFLYKEAIERSKVEGTNYKFILTSKPEAILNGVKGMVQHKESGQLHQILIGNKSMLSIHSTEQNPETKEGGTKLFLTIDNETVLTLYLNTHSNLRPQTKTSIDVLRKMGKEVHILSGDSKESVQLLGDSLGLPSQWLHPEQTPTMKKEWISSIQSQNKGVVMIGDGLNDILCLKEALIGVSISAKSEMNLNAANVVLVTENLKSIPILLDLLKKSRIFIYTNLMWAFLYNILMLPVVSGALYFVNPHAYVSPVFSSLAMSISSLVVVAFSQLLKCVSFEIPSEARNAYTPLTLTVSKSLGSEFRVLNEEV